MENKAQLVSMLFDITLRLKNQMDHNRTTTTTLLAKAHTLKVKNHLFNCTIK
jgi:hypothetical protein